MPDCTHGDVRPCAGCRILAAGYDAARQGAVPAWRTRVLMEAHAAAAIEPWREYVSGIAGSGAQMERGVVGPTETD